MKSLKSLICLLVSLILFTNISCQNATKIEYRNLIDEVISDSLFVPSESYKRYNYVNGEIKFIENINYNKKVFSVEYSNQAD